MYWLWAAAFMLKVIGATWDASWHFKHLRETLGIPHIVNTVGFLLSVGLTLYQTRTQRFADDRSKWTVWAGLCLFLLGMPADELYHRAYGIDLTTWSPTHAMLYIGTFMMIAGTFAGYLRDRAAGRAPDSMLLTMLFCLFLMEDVLFPLGQQEYGAVVLWLISVGRPLADAELLRFVTDPFHQVYSSLPLWLYPVYLTFGYLFAARLARRFVPHRWAATMATGVYLLYRTLAWGVFHTANFPVSFIPYFAILLAVVVDLSALVQPGALRHLTCAGAGAMLVYGAAYLWPQLAVMPVWPMNSLWAAVLAGMAGLLLADGLALLLGDRPVPTGRGTLPREA